MPEMAPPSAPAASNSASLNILPSNQGAVNSASSSNLQHPLFPGLPNPAVVHSANQDAGTGPLRHPRPMTASDLHQEMEKEQEAVVSRVAS